ncbi:hypothetical protein FACS1894180_4220 [Bacteroidia bacterium]|nr:hypothetical protein FACS1894180_4220 [Bacteroidia bacterium]
MKYMNINELTEKVIKAAYVVHNKLVAGFLENLYEKTLFIELKKMNIDAECQYSMPVYYDDVQIGSYFADLFVEEQLIVALKAVENLTVGHEKQLVNYLAATGIDNGLLINFGSSVVVKRKFRKYVQKDSQNTEDFQN